MKLKVSHKLVVEIAVADNLRFGKEFTDGIKKLANSIAQQFNVLHLSFDGDDTTLRVCFNGPDLSKAFELRAAFLQQAVLMAEHGPDSDLLNNLLDRYPDLKVHPRLHNIVNAFENLSRVVHGALEDTSGRTLAAVQSRAGDEIDLGDLQASGAAKSDMTKDARVEFRKLSILGQTDEQRLPRPKSVEPVIPEVYKKLTEATPPEYGEYEPGDEGNVFTRGKTKS